jgi:hypothetical protein
MQVHPAVLTQAEQARPSLDHRCTSWPQGALTAEGIQHIDAVWTLGGLCRPSDQTGARAQQVGEHEELI